MKVLVTGSAGTVGRPVCQELARRGHQVRGLDRAPSPELADAIVGDIADADVVATAMRGVDALVHLAAQPVDAPFAELVGPNVVGLYNVMNAARGAGVRRIVLTSSMLVASGGRGDHPAHVDEARPPNHYALTKLWAEQGEARAGGRLPDPLRGQCGRGARVRHGAGAASARVRAARALARRAPLSAS